ncbi:MAG TPA: DUF2218 domain-containing protein [Roseiarcus sp.]|nr:DUF2218 domain-containing protein [Roseiarcus sp.]
MNELTLAASQVHRVADVETANASRYLQQLCKHFQHKLPVAFDPHAGRIEFPSGECRLEADDARLQLFLAAPDAEAMERLQDVVARHLLRFAFREDLKVDWRAAE